MSLPKTLLTVTFISFLTWILATPAVAQTTYTCTAHIDPFVNFNDCNGTDVDILSHDPSESKRRAVVDLNASASWKYMVLRVAVCNPQGWTVHIGDSPTNNGYGGDASSTSHDAEMQWLNGNVRTYFSDIGGSGCANLYGSSTCNAQASVSGCATQQYYVDNDLVAFFPDGTFGSVDFWWNQNLFDLPLYDEADPQDPTKLYEDKLYVGLNRTYGSSNRSGSGLYRACFYLRADLNFDLDDITTECGF